MDITTIIPTLCEGNRRQQLLRAIASIHLASTAPVRVLVIVNGQRFDVELLAHLRARADLEVIQVAEGSQTNAQLVGRRAVRGEFFAFLDDDDEFLPGALDLRRRMLDADSTAAAAVTNGYDCIGGKDSTFYSRIGRVESDPLFELFQENWLHNCNHLFRSASVGADYFVNAPAVMEWTWLGFRLVTEGKRIIASESMTFRYYDTPGSLSKSTAFLVSRVGIYARMLRCHPRGDIAALIRRRTCAAWHEVAMEEMRVGNRAKAIGAHTRSLVSHWSGLKYMPYSRHLM